MSNNNLMWLLKWYYNQLNGDWKLGKGITIHTIDNPGWDLMIYLNETALQDKQFQKIIIDRSEHDWIRCYIEDKMFTGVGGPFNFPEIFQIFRNWTDSFQKEDSNFSGEIRQVQTRDIPNGSIFGGRSDDNLMWLLKWFHSQCDGDWEHENFVDIHTIAQGWYFRISIEETELGNKKFQEVNNDRSEHDWIQCFIKDREFNAVGGPFNLPEILHIFRNWAESYQAENLAWIP